MSSTMTTADEILNVAMEAVERGDNLFDALEALPAPIYVTDAEGLILSLIHI